MSILKAFGRAFERYFAIMVIVLVVAGILTAIIAPQVANHRRALRMAEWEANQAAERRERAEEKRVQAEKIGRRDWPNKPPPPLPEFEMIDFEIDDSFPPASNADPQTGNLVSNAFVRTEWMVDHHPSTEISHHFREMVLGKRVGVNVTDRLDENTVASFNTIPIEAARTTLPEHEPESIGRVPLFSLNRQKIDKVATAREAKVIMIFLYHEWLHYLQYTDAIQADRSEEVDVFVSITPDGQMSEQSCAYHWQHELDAWRDTCHFVGQLGMIDRFEKICPWVGEDAAFRQAYFNYNAQHLATGGGKYKECVAVNARLAGHPYPESFIDE